MMNDREQSTWAAIKELDPEPEFPPEGFNTTTNPPTIAQVAIFTHPNGYQPHTTEISNGSWPGLEDSIVGAIGQDLWDDLKALDPPLPPQEG